MDPDKPPAGPPALMIAGTHSGVGKTSLTVALAMALRAKGLRVQVFKVGPDYIDPTYHAHVTGRAGRNLDTWLMGRRGVRQAFARAGHNVDRILVEGMMGLFDGQDPTSDRGSSAEVARLLGIPVVLVLDAGAMARSAAAVTLGFQRLLSPGLLAGVVCNRVAGPGHAELLRQAIAAVTGTRVLGTIAPLQSSLPERHLGLVPVPERGDLDAELGALAGKVLADLDLEALLSAFAPPRGRLPAPPAGPTPPARVPIAVARDAAFSFYYEDNLELLEQAGAEIVYFSPLAGELVPPLARGLYVGGGFPEEHAAGLSAQAKARADVRGRVLAGMPTVAECGGYMYLGESVEDRGGRTHPMVGAIPASFHMHERLVGFGYREVEALADGPLLRRSERARGHEFHHSSMRLMEPARPALRRVDGPGGDAGYQRGNLFASYVHLHFASRPAMARRFVAACARWRPGADGPTA